MRKGSVLVVTLVIVIFLSLTVIMMLALYSQLVNNYTLQQKKLLVSNVAKSGAYTLASYLINRREIINQLMNKTFTARLPEFRGEVTYQLSGSDPLTLRCTARLDNVSDTYSLTFRVSPSEIYFPEGLVVQGSAYFYPNMIVNGDVIYLGSQTLNIPNNVTINGNLYVSQASVVLGNNVSITGTIYLPKGATLQKPDSLQVNVVYADFFDQPAEYPLPYIPPINWSSLPNLTVPNNGTATISATVVYYNEIVVNQRGVLTILANSDVKIYVNKITLRQNADLRIVGNGKVDIYFKESLWFNENSNLITRTKVVFASDSAVQIRFDCNFSGSQNVYVYAPATNLVIKNNALFQGAAIVKDGYIRNNAVFIGPQPNSDLPSVDVRSMTYERWGT